MSERVIILDWGVEGGGDTIYGSSADGVWQFWREGSSGGMLDDPDEDPVIHWKTEPSPELPPVDPKLPWIFPIQVHPEFADKFVADWRAACAASGRFEGTEAETRLAKGERHWQQAVESWQRRLGR